MRNRPQEPVAPTHDQFTDEEGYTDYEAYDVALSGFHDDWAGWWEEHGEINQQMDTMWARREKDLANARY